MLDVVLSYRSVEGEKGSLSLRFVNNSFKDVESVLVHFESGRWSAKHVMVGYSLWSEGGFALIARGMRMAGGLAPNRLANAIPMCVKLEVSLAPNKDDTLSGHVSTLAFERKNQTAGRARGTGFVGAGSGPMDIDESMSMFEVAARLCLMLGFESPDVAYPSPTHMRVFRDGDGNGFVFLEDAPPTVMGWFKAYISLLGPKKLASRVDRASLPVWEAFQAGKLFPICPYTLLEGK